MEIPWQIFWGCLQYSKAQPKSSPRVKAEFIYQMICIMNASELFNPLVISCGNLIVCKNSKKPWASSTSYSFIISNIDTINHGLIDWVWYTQITLWLKWVLFRGLVPRCMFIIWIWELLTAVKFIIYSSETQSVLFRKLFTYFNFRCFFIHSKGKIVLAVIPLSDQHEMLSYSGLQKLHSWNVWSPICLSSTSLLCSCACEQEAWTLLHNESSTSSPSLCVCLRFASVSASRSSFSSLTRLFFYIPSSSVAVCTYAQHSWTLITAHSFRLFTCSILITSISVDPAMNVCQ